jgi:hypothetical protein
MPSRKKLVPAGDAAPEAAPEQTPPKDKPKGATNTGGTRSKRQEAAKKESPKKEVVKKTVTKKPAAKKSVSRKVVAKKTGPPRAQIKKRVVGATKAKSVKKTKKAKPLPTSSPYTKYQIWVAEAVQVLKTPEHPLVSFNKIRQYLLDYLDVKQPFRIPKLAKQACLSLLQKKLLKAKKDSYSFTKLGEEKIAPSKVEKRKKVVRVEKKQKIPKTKEPVRNPVILGTGRVSRPLQFA